MVGGKSVPGTRITVEPYTDSMPRKTRWAASKRWSTRSRSPTAFPGNLVKVDIHAPATGTPTFVETLDLPAETDAVRAAGVGSLVLAAVVGLCATAPLAGEPAGVVNDYPTDARADYVLGCMASNNQTRAALEHCSCSIDVIASILPYDKYEQAETILSMREGVGAITREFNAIKGLNDIGRRPAPRAGGGGDPLLPVARVGARLLEWRQSTVRSAPARAFESPSGSAWLPPPVRQRASQPARSWARLRWSPLTVQ